MVEQLKELWEITEMRDGCVYKTRNTGETVWVADGEKASEGFIFVSISDPNVQTIRMK